MNGSVQNVNRQYEQLRQVIQQLCVQRLVLVLRLCQLFLRLQQHTSLSEYKYNCHIHWATSANGTTWKEVTTISIHSGRRKNKAQQMTSASWDQEGHLTRKIASKTSKDDGSQKCGWYSTYSTIGEPICLNQDLKLFCSIMLLPNTDLPPAPLKLRPYGAKENRSL